VPSSHTSPALVVAKACPLHSILDLQEWNDDADITDNDSYSDESDDSDDDHADNDNNSTMDTNINETQTYDSDLSDEELDTLLGLESTVHPHTAPVPNNPVPVQHLDTLQHDHVTDDEDKHARNTESTGVGDNEPAHQTDVTGVDEHPDADEPPVEIDHDEDRCCSIIASTKVVASPVRRGATHSCRTYVALTVLFPKSTKT